MMFPVVLVLLSSLRVLQSLSVQAQPVLVSCIRTNQDVLVCENYELPPASFLTWFCLIDIKSSTLHSGLNKIKTLYFFHRRLCLTPTTAQYLNVADVAILTQKVPASRPNPYPATEPWIASNDMRMESGVRTKVGRLEDTEKMPTLTVLSRSDLFQSHAEQTDSCFHTSSNQSFHYGLNSFHINILEHYWTAVE